MKKLMHFMTAIVLLLLLQACRSTKLIEVVRVPLLDFPEFPLADYITDNHDGTSTVPSKWLVELEEYHIRIGSTEKDYNRLKELYEGN